MSKLVDILGGNVLKSVGEILDNLNTSKEEKLLAKQAMKDLLVKAESQAQEQVSRRWEADMKADNWLSKNIRPLILIFLTFILVLLSFLDGNIGGFTINEAYKPIYQTLLITVYVSCVPKSVYKVLHRTSEKYKKHFILQDVRDRRYILIHQGNFNTDTRGCILVGSSFRQVNNDSLLDITSSKRTLSQLLEATEGEVFELTIT